MQILVPALCAIVGALVYALSSNAKAAELGRVLYLGAVIALMIAFTNRTVHLF